MQGHGYVGLQPSLQQNSYLFDRVFGLSHPKALFSPSSSPSCYRIDPSYTSRQKLGSVTVSQSKVL